ncbi:class III lanthionine synthetase LanKC [Paenibacillus polysaccharolyticus]|uniref:class III lanthionine synthetase LanKC n=1 Tax=Paenibacillus polysaccharolyticus TaxID=582692 RepID=UPI0020405484|nr:class III lanthionine synthetase LanKC [Paenibacillus polysaccharolyticus]MCM3133511.1 class III lanthionine synthetase LanKC [Paenibacillus polysaccharolyticus]
MEGNMLYNLYLKPDSEYYGKFESPEEKTHLYELRDLPNTYAVISDRDSVWKHYHAKGSHLPDQGWKIHVTALFEESQTLLEKVAKVCIDEKVEFKHLKDKQSFIKVNSKNASRSSSGKFMTIYPVNNEAFLRLLDAISLATSDFQKGPYILSDRRWKDSNVFYRYGGFKSIFNEYGEHCIRDNHGRLIKDERTPFYQVPDFVKDFDDYLNTLNGSTDSDDAASKSDSNLDRYEIETALSYSNAGGVYSATRKEDNLRVIIKEARPNAGLDGGAHDALSRQTREYEALVKLQDISGVVNFIEYFQEWEHFFLVEEFIEGIDLRQWLAKHYPFFRDREGMNEHAEQAKKILLQLYTLIEEMHQKGVAMGDFQPANIMVMQDLTVRLIDFETAMPVGSDEKPTMMTIGFASQKIKFSGARDWFGLKKIIRYLALPVLSSEVLDVHLQHNHYRWIKELYEDSFYEFIIDLQMKCDLKIQEVQSYSPEEIKPDAQLNNLDISSIMTRLIKGLQHNLTNDERFINGDIRQFEMNGGRYNFLTGGSGAAYVLTRNKANTADVNQWIQDYLLNHLNKIEENGLITGKTGVLTLLYEMGYQDVVLKELKTIRQRMNDTNNISLRSGLSGIGLFVISLYFETGDYGYLIFAKEVEQLIEMKREKEGILSTNDWMAVEIGAIDGLSGVSLFYSAMYSATSDAAYLDKAKQLIHEDLKQTIKDEVTGSMQTLDNRNRQLPYLSGGSIGIGVCIWFLNHVSGEDLFHEEMKAITRLSGICSTISGGLFDGAGSFLLLASIVEQNQEREQMVKEVLNLLNIFLIDRQEYYVYPGQFSYRLADDVYSGSSGIILALMCIVKNNPLYWLPLINPDEFMAKTKANHLLATN